MGLTESTSYPGIDYCGAAKTWRKVTSPDNLSLLFVFQNAPGDLSPAMVSKLLTERYGDSTFDGMRSVHKNPEWHKLNPNDENAPTSYELVYEAHFFRNTDRQAALLQSFSSPSYKAPKIEKVLVQKDEFPYGTAEISMEVMSPIPSTPCFSAYTIVGLPLGSCIERCNLVKKNVINIISKYACSTEATISDIEAKHFVDIIPGSAGLYFDGSVTVIIKDITVLDPEDFEFQECGKTLSVSKHGTHFLYCSNCRCLDSHSQDECPFSEPRRLQYH